jgi:translocation protein SEC66
MASVLVPVLYVGIVVSSLLLFSHFSRKRNAGKHIHLLPLCRSRLILTCHNHVGKIYEPYFPSHPERDIYVSLLQQSDPPAHESLLKAALVRRAMTDVSRVLKLREDKPAAQNLLQKGSVGDDLWNSLLQAEKELEAEIMEVVAEANTFVEGWGGLIFQTAGEMIANEKIRTVYEETAASRLAKGACTHQFLNTAPLYRDLFTSEQKYGKVGTKIDLPLPQQLLSGPPPPGHPAHAAALAAAAAGPAPAPTPNTPAKPPNGLQPPQNTKAESVASSDGESHDTTSSPSKSVSISFIILRKHLRHSTHSPRRGARSVGKLYTYYIIHLFIS